jgi:hypothetical protein
MAQNYTVRVVSGDQCGKEFLVSLEQEIFVKSINNLKCVRVLSAVILKKFATYAWQSRFYGRTPFFECDVNCQALGVQWLMCGDLGSTLSIEMEGD